MKVVFAFILVIFIIYIYTYKKKKSFHIQEKFDTSIDNIYCINLESNKERFYLLDSMAKNAKLSLTRFEAVDTRGDLYLQYKNIIHPVALEDMHQTLWRNKRIHEHGLTPGAIGCYLSHMSLYKEALNRGDKMIIVFEDDTQIPNNFKEGLLERMKNLPENWDMFLLGWIPMGKENKLITQDLYHVHRFILMHAYVITDVGMRKMLSLCMPVIKKQVDHAVSDFSHTIRIYGTNPRGWIKQGSPSKNDAYRTNIQIPLLKREVENFKSKQPIPKLPWYKSLSPFHNVFAKKIPNTIWTFWEGEYNPVINSCIRSWKTHNPTWRVVVLNKNNLNKYLPHFDIEKWSSCLKSIQHFSDIVRCKILLKNGGIWCDASILCFGSFDWIIDLQKKKKYEFIGYHINNDNPNYPVIENWFFAAIPNSILIKKWCAQLSRVNQYKNTSDFVDKLKTECDISKVSIPYYLWMHCAMQKVLQTNDKFHYKIFSAQKGPFKFLDNNKWDHKMALDEICNNILKNKCYEEYGSFVKFIGASRKNMTPYHVKVISNIQ